MKKTDNTFFLWEKSFSILHAKRETYTHHASRTVLSRTVCLWKGFPGGTKEPAAKAGDSRDPTWFGPWVGEIFMEGMVAHSLGSQL